MNINLHKNARTTPAVRKEIRESTASDTELALHYGLSRATIHKWRNRQGMDDASHCPHTLQTTLTPAQEIIVIEIRKTLLLPIDDLLVVVREFMNKDVSRSGLEHRLITPYHLQTNGMVERFNGRIQEILDSTKFDSREDLEETLIRYARIYNDVGA